MKTFGGQNMRFDTPQERLQRRAHRADRIGHRRQRDRHAFELIAITLPVQRLMLAKFLEHDHGQKTGTGPTSRHGMERGWRLADLLAVPATELLAYRFDDLPLPGHAFQSAGHVFTELA